MVWVGRLSGVAVKLSALLVSSSVVDLLLLWSGVFFFQDHLMIVFNRVCGWVHDRGVWRGRNGL